MRKKWDIWTAEDYYPEPNKRSEDRIPRRRQVASAAGNTRGFYKAVKKMNCKEVQAPWDVRRMRPGSSDKDIAEEIASFFNRISGEFDPLVGPFIPDEEDRYVEAAASTEIIVVETLISVEQLKFIQGKWTA